MNMHGLKVGDRITFRAVTRWSDRSATRVVNGHTLGYGYPTVRFGGYAEFVVRPSEISVVTRKGE